MMLQKKIIALVLSGLMLSACSSSDDDAVAVAGSAVSLKEGRSQTLNGASGSGEGSVTVAWTQVSGPDLTISGANTLTPQITAPSVDTDSSALLRFTVTDSKGQVANDELTVTILNNTLPKLAEQPAAVAEKAEVQLTPKLTDDGEITSITWQQIAGPEVDLSADSGATVSFATPAVTENTTLTFTLDVTDDDGEVADITLNVLVEPNLIALTLAGEVIGADFSGSTATLSGAAEPVTTTVDAAGTFSFNMQLDDDLLNNVVSVAVSAVDNSRLTYSAVYSGFSQPAAVASASYSGEAVTQKLSTATDGSYTVAVSAVSTALYSLLVVANDGVVPENIGQLVFVEKSVDADELTEAAAVVKILTENPEIQLPEGVTDITSLLTNVEAFNTVVQQIETGQPGLIADTVAVIIADPELTPPVSADAIAPVYYQTFAAAPGFLSRGGDQWRFNQDGSGRRINRIGSDGFTWNVDETGAITVIYSDGFPVTSFPSVSVGVAGLTEQQVNWLQADNIYQIEVETKTIKSVLKRITTGQKIDSFQIESETVTRVLPVQTSQGLVETAVTNVSNGNHLMRKQVSEQYAFLASEMVGDWAINSYYTMEVFGQPEPAFYLDVLQFNSDGTGIGTDTDRTFSWTVNNGLLTVTFSDNSSLEARIIDVSGSDYQVFSVAKDSANNAIAAQADYGFRVDHDAELDWVTGSDSYWQTMINSWSKASWDNGRLLFCSGDPQCQEANPYLAVWGWQLIADFSGTLLNVNYNDYALPPLFEPDRTSLNWDSQADNADWLAMFYYSGSTLYQRSWDLLKTEPGILGTRIYVREQASRSNPDWDNRWNGIYIGGRISMYEQIPVSYWNDTAPQATVNGVTVKTTAIKQQRLVVNPTKNDISVN